MIWIRLMKKYEREKIIYVPAKWILERNTPFPEKIVMELEGGTVVKTKIKRITVKKGVDFGRHDEDIIKDFMEENGKFNDFPPYLKQDRVYRLEIY